ncbi:MAG: alpha-galactosidase [Vibrionaceae bacterium]
MKNTQNIPELITLTGSKSQLILRIDHSAQIVHWGAPVQQVSHMAATALERAIPYGRLDVDVPMTLSPELARGVFSSPGLEGHREGLDWAPAFVVTHVEQKHNSVRITSVDEIAQLQLVSEIALAEDVLKVRHSLTNLHQKAYWVQRFANTLPLPERAKELLTFYGRWVNEFQTCRLPLTQGGFQQENRRGRTSHEHYPALIAGSANFGELNGEVWGFHLAWSGNHRLRIDVKADGRRFMQAEALYLPGEIALGHNESISTPWLYASFSEDGLNSMSQQFHAHVRKQILPASVTQKTRPVHLNTWEGIYFDHDPHYIAEMATQAAQMGVERFIIDDGWFRARNNDKAALGDWFIDENKYPDGLTPLITQVKNLGMQFGIWFEPEMISKDSDLYRAHPDWLLGVAGYEQPTGRNQYAIDLQNDAAFNYLFERLDHFLSHYQIDYIKWDMNREIVQPGHNGRAAGTAQVTRYYQLVDKLRERHPQVEIESCAAGGGRIDFEVLKRVHRFWPSDNNDALERQAIQRGMSYFFPPEVMGSHIGASHCHSTRRRHSIQFRGLTALFGHMGIELDPVKECAVEKEGFERYIQLHKALRPLLHTGTTWRIPSDDPAHQIQAVISEDRSQALVMVAQLAMPTNSLSGHLRLPGLSPEKTYQISVLDQPDNYTQIVNRQPPWTLEGCQLSGQWCEKIGLALPVLDPETAILIKIEQIS